MGTEEKQPMMLCTLCGYPIRDKIYVRVAVPAVGGTRYEPRHLACDTRLRRIMMHDIEPGPGDTCIIRRRILSS